LLHILVTNIKRQGREKRAFVQLQIDCNNRVPNTLQFVAKSMFLSTSMLLC